MFYSKFNAIKQIHTYYSAASTFSGIRLKYRTVTILASFLVMPSPECDAVHPNTTRRLPCHSTLDTNYTELADILALEIYRLSISSEVQANRSLHGLLQSFKANAGIAY